MMGVEQEMGMQLHLESLEFRLVQLRFELGRYEFVLTETMVIFEGIRCPDDRPINDEIDVINKVINAIDKGETNVHIDFPASIRKRSIDSQFSGEIRWSSVIQSLRALLLDEVETVSVGKMKVGGCCGSPKEYAYCCEKKYKAHNDEVFSNIYLSF